MLAPFPWFGGKSRAAPLIWQAFGSDVRNYVEPFAGSLAALLARPGTDIGIETVNDADGFLANFWRALAADPDAVARHADWPVNEIDLSARHLWLVGQRESLTERLQVDPAFYDAKIAGWWVWGLCAWIGSGWCSGKGPWTSDGARWIDRRDAGNAGMGINRQLPHLGNAGRGINRKLPHLGDAGRIADMLAPLSDRLRRVRVACGDWRRVVTDSVTVKHGATGVLLDPPYTDGFDAEKGCYSAGGGADVWRDAAAWAVGAGTNPRLRIVLCGYEGCWEPPADWRAVPWKARKGYAGQGDGGNDNRHRERLWLSPGCLGGTVDPALFGAA
jgi:DNA adenine methylase